MVQAAVEFSGRSFTSDEINHIRQTVRTFSNLSLRELSKTICELLDWKRPTGKLKYEECRAMLEKIQADGIHVGCTQGRGRMDREHTALGQSVKDIYLYPLSNRAQDKLRKAIAPVFIDKEEADAF